MPLFGKKKAETSSCGRRGTCDTENTAKAGETSLQRPQNQLFSSWEWIRRSTM